MPVCGCSRKHVLDNCSTFREMTPKQAGHGLPEAVVPVLHETSNGQGVLDYEQGAHQKMLHEALKAGEHKAPAQVVAQRTRSLAAAGEVQAPMTYLKRELLEGLGIDPDILDVRREQESRRSRLALEVPLKRRRERRAAGS